MSTPVMKPSSGSGISSNREEPNPSISSLFSVLPLPAFIVDPASHLLSSVYESFWSPRFWFPQNASRQYSWTDFENPPEGIYYPLPRDLLPAVWLALLVVLLRYTLFQLYDTLSTSLLTSSIFHLSDSFVYFEIKFIYLI